MEEVWTGFGDEVHITLANRTIPAKPERILKRGGTGGIFIRSASIPPPTSAMMSVIPPITAITAGASIDHPRLNLYTYACYSTQIIGCSFQQELKNSPQVHEYAHCRTPMLTGVPPDQGCPLLLHAHACIHGFPPCSQVSDGTTGWLAVRRNCRFSEARGYSKLGLRPRYKPFTRLRPDKIIPRSREACNSSVKIVPRLSTSACVAATPTTVMKSNS